MKLQTATIEADATVPMIHIHRDFAATPEQLMEAHLNPDLFVKWVGPRGSDVRVDYWTPHTGGAWRFVGSSEAGEYAFRGCFHQVGEARIVQTFTWEGQPDDVALETLEFTDLGYGRTHLHARSLCDSFAARDQWLMSGMESGVNDGYGKLDELLADGLS